MPRPTKLTVDYFPHFVADSKTKFMLENRWGNDGYAFWFKLLELLCRSDGHYYNCSSIADWEYLLALTKVNEQTALEIMDKLSEMGKVDNELWSKNKTIWCASLVENLGPVYSKRTVSAPKKPEYLEFPHRKLPETGVIGVDNPQSKVKESIVDESITPPYIPPQGENANEANKSGESLLVETATDEPSKVSHSRTRKPRTQKTELTPEQRLSFDKFWEVWPNKVSKGQAERTWQRLDPDDGLTKAIISGVLRSKKYDNRFKPGGYTPHPSTWLNSKGWLDEFGEGGHTVERDSGHIGQHNTTAYKPQFKPSTGFRKG